MPARLKKKNYPEEQLIRLIREQHPNGAAALYDMYSASLYGVITRIVPDTMRSEDVLQETFLRSGSVLGSMILKKAGCTPG